MTSRLQRKEVSLDGPSYLNIEAHFSTDCSSIAQTLAFAGNSKINLLINTQQKWPTFPCPTSEESSFAFKQDKRVSYYPSLLYSTLYMEPNQSLSVLTFYVSSSSNTHPSSSLHIKLSLTPTSKACHVSSVPDNTPYPDPTLPSPSASSNYASSILPRIDPNYLNH